MNIRLYSLIVGTLAAAACAAAQNMAPAQIPECSTALGVILENPVLKDQRIRQALDYEQSAACFSKILYRSVSFWDVVKDFQSNRNDNQAGAPVGSGGTTSLVSRGLAAKAFSVAAEYGALTQSVNNQVVTIRGTLGGALAALSGQGLFEYCPTGEGISPCLSQRLLDHLKRVSYGVSFDTSQNSQTSTAMPSGAAEGTAQPVAFTASRRQVTAWNARIDVWKTRDITSKGFQTKLNETLSSNDPQRAARLRAAATELMNAFKAFAQALKQQLGDDYNDQYGSEVAAFSTLTTQAAIDERFNAWAAAFLRRVDNNPDVLAKARDLVGKRSFYRLTAEDFVAALADQPVLTFEYVDNRPVGQEPFSTIRIIFDKGAGKWSFAFNGAVTFYDQKPTLPGADRWRDAQVAAQLQRELGTFLSVPASVSLSYYFQYQNSPAIFDVKPGEPLPGITFVNLPEGAQQAFVKTGNLHLAQFRLMMSPKQSSVRIPFAVSYSNRTELVNKPAWRAQIGISYDFDSLFGK